MRLKKFKLMHIKNLNNLSFDSFQIMRKISVHAYVVNLPIYVNINSIFNDLLSYSETFKSFFVELTTD